LSPASIEGHFLGEPGQRIFVLRRPAQGTARGCVLLVPPFAEEMNKSRRMLSDVGAQLAQQGYDILLPDLYGTGDSDGDFGDADWVRWRQDLATTAAWSAKQGRPVNHLLAVRLGCGLAADALAHGELGPMRASVLWQPVFDGERLLNQFLRLRVAASMMDGDRKETIVSLRAEFAAGRSVEVAGYALSPQLVAGLDSLKNPSSVPDGFGRAHWMEVVREAGAPLPQASARIAEAVRANGVSAEILCVAGEPFWSSTEIVRISELVEATVNALAAEQA